MFSILIPTFNNLEYLKFCINSIKKNSKYNHQIVCHINVGDDGTIEYLKKEKIAEAGMGLDPIPGDAMAAQLEYDDLALANAGAEEAVKGGLKSTLGKAAGGIGAGLSIASGAKRLQSEDEMTRVGGALQVGGGVAGAVALTNFWNPVGWAAAIPAALSIGGGLIGGGSSDSLGKTPIGRARRRLNIS